jgi:hypothetical protein
MTEHTTIELAAIEAGAKARFDAIQAERRDSARTAPDGGPWRWEHLTEQDRHAMRAFVEPIVIAALAVGK